jgi:transketolase
MKEMRDHFGDKLLELGMKDKRIICLDADLNTSTKIDLFKNVLPTQFIQAGIAEQNMFGIAAGLASCGLIPFPTTFAVFASKRACDQVSISIAYPRLNVKIPGCYCGVSTGKSGATHQSVEDLAIMRSMPNMRVLDPADAVELKQMMDNMVIYDGPVYFRVLRPSVPDIFDESYRFDWKPILLKGGTDIAIVSTGYMTHVCLNAANELEKCGIHASVLHVPCLKPLDPELLIKTAEKCKTIITVENHSIIGGLGGAVCEILSEHSPVPIKRLGVNDMFVETGEDEDIYRKYGLTLSDVKKAVIQIKTS